MFRPIHLLQLGVTWDIYLRELLCHREEVLSGMRIFSSESVVFHLVFWVSSCSGVLGCVGVWVCCVSILFFCWWLLGLIPGGAPFSQLRNGVKDAMVGFTK